MMPVTVKQALTIGLSIALLSGLYFFGKTTAPPEQKAAEEQEVAPEQTAAVAFDWGEFIRLKTQQLPPSDSAVVQATVERLDSSSETSHQRAALQSLIERFEEMRQPAISAYFHYRLAQGDSTTENWLHAGDKLASAFMVSSDNRNLGAQLFDLAESAYQQALQSDSANTDVRIKLASLYMEGGDNVMQGVTMLLGIVDENPDHPEANLILGKYGIISGQYEKAIKRLEKVITLQPQNSEAYYYLAEAKLAMDNTEAAIRLFEECKRLVNDPRFSHEIDNYIKKINAADGS